MLGAGVGMKIRPHVNCDYQMMSEKVHYSFVFLMFLEDFNSTHKFWEMHHYCDML